MKKYLFFFCLISLFACRKKEDTIDYFKFDFLGASFNFGREVKLTGPHKTFSAKSSAANHDSIYVEYDGGGWLFPGPAQFFQFVLRVNNEEYRLAAYDSTGVLLPKGEGLFSSGNETKWTNMYKYQYTSGTLSATVYHITHKDGSGRPISDGTTRALSNGKFRILVP